MFGFLAPILGGLFGSSAATAATIGAAGSLASGALGARSAQKAVDKQNEYNDPANVRARAENAGFNPLLFVGPGVGNQTAPAQSGHMGAAVADASMMAANAISGQAEGKARLQQLQLQNEKLQKEINAMTLRPKTAGIYGAAPLGTKGVVKVDTFDPETHQGPLPMVNVFDGNAEKWDKIPPGVAQRLGVKDGQTLIADDLTQWRGELAGEATTLVKLLDGVTKPAQDWWENVNSYPGRSKQAPRISIRPPSRPSGNQRTPLRLTFTGP